MLATRRTSRTLLAATGALALTAALAGCGELTVLNAGSTASCEPDGAPVTLTTAQDASGEELRIRYRGPADLAVVFSYGYSLEDIPEAASTGAYAYSQSTSNAGQTTAYLLRLDPSADAGWTHSVSGGVLDATFTGNVDELLDGRDAHLANDDGTSIGEVASAFIAVNCDVDFESSEVDTLATNEGTPPDLLLAAPLNPGNVRLGPFVITSQATVDGATTGTLRFDENAAEAFDGFVPSTLAESSLALDVADVPDDTFSHLWFQEFIRNAPIVGTFAITSPLTLDGDMNFTITSGAGAVPLPDELMRLRLVFGNTDLGDASTLAELGAARDATDVADLDLSGLAPAAAGDAKAVFFDVEFDEATGVSFASTLPVPSDEEEAPQEELADTGASMPMTAIGGAALLLAAAGVALARRSRRA